MTNSSYTHTITEKDFTQNSIPCSYYVGKKLGPLFIYHEQNTKHYNVFHNITVKLIVVLRKYSIVIICNQNRFERTAQLLKDFQRLYRLDIYLFSKF